MNDKPQLGVVRICACGTVWEIPYFANDEFDRMVIASRAHGAFQLAGIFVPYEKIDWMVMVPAGTKHDFSMGMTRQ